MQLFSERYGYVKPREAFVIEDFPQEIANDVCTALDMFNEELSHCNNEYCSPYTKFCFWDLEKYVWSEFLHKRLADIDDLHSYEQEVTANTFLSKIPWYRKLDLLEEIVGYLFRVGKLNSDRTLIKLTEILVKRLNSHFEMAKYGYRIVENQVVPITDSVELETIIAAVDEHDATTTHLQEALNLYAKRPTPDYRNSVKESITAVEALCREITGESTLDRAIPKLKIKGVNLQSQFEEGLKRLYYYTNDSTTGVRHALLDDTFVPTEADAHFMLVTCSAFINYIRMKSSAITK